MVYDLPSQSLPRLAYRRKPGLSPYWREELPEWAAGDQEAPRCQQPALIHQGRYIPVFCTPSPFPEKPI